MLTDPDFEIIPAKKFTVLIARFTSSMMMHLGVTDEIRQGLILMKWSVNHPDKFKNYKKVRKDGTEVYSVRRIIFGFLLGFMQAMIGIVVEVAIIVYLASLNGFLDIIMKFFSMAAITKFDDMYAASLPEEKFSAVAGKYLPIEYKRYMGRLYYREHERNEESSHFNE